MYCYTLHKILDKIYPWLYTYLTIVLYSYVSDQHTYLGVIIHKSLSWSPHISDIITKASKTLNFITRNLSKRSSQVKESAYLTMVRPQLEYASDVWDPHYVGDIMELEKV